MSDILSNDFKKPMEQPEHNLLNAIGKISVTTDNSRKNSPSLSDMPVDVVGLIIERSEYKEQLKLRKVSKSLRALVDKLKPACKSIDVSFWSESVTIDFDDRRVKYQSYHEYNDDGSIVIRDDFEKAALDDLASTLKNPKLQLEELSVCFAYSQNKDIEIEKCCNKIRNVSESLNPRVSVKEINLQGSIPSCLLSILPYLKPGVLETISLDELDSNSHANEMDQVALLDQWKQAEQLELCRSFDGFPMKHATHFKRFRNVEGIDGDMFIRIKDVLEFLKEAIKVIFQLLSKLDNFEQCDLLIGELTFDPDLMYELLGAPVSSNSTYEVFHHPISDSDYYLEFTKPTKTDDIRIVKKKRESN